MDSHRDERRPKYRSTGTSGLLIPTIIRGSHALGAKREKFALFTHNFSLRVS